jgi:hypothetical protein
MLSQCYSRMYLSSCYVGDKVYPERLTTGGITDTNRKELKVYQIPQEDL